MKTRIVKSLHRYIVTSALASAFCILPFAFCPSASAGPVNLNITNFIQNGQSITSYPTNSAATNGNPAATGTAAYVVNYDHLGFDFQGQVLNTTSSNAYNALVGIIIVTSMSGNQPKVSTSTNSYYTTAVPTQNDFATVGPGVLTFVVPIPLTATSTNWVNFQTNFPNTSVLAEANYVGVYQITNNLPTGITITNAVAHINPKIKPFALTGGNF